MSDIEVYDYIADDKPHEEFEMQNNRVYLHSASPATHTSRSRRGSEKSFWHARIAACFVLLLVAYAFLSGAAIVFAFLKIYSLETESSQQLNTVYQQVNQSVADIKSDIQQCACTPCGDTGSSSSKPATSCAALPGSCTSGYYWVRASNGSAVHVYCDMTRSCGGVTGGWTRIAHLDMSNDSHQCPDGLILCNESNVLTCRRRSTPNSCAAVPFPSHSIEYTMVCGQIIAYQFASPDAFSDQEFGRTADTTIDDPYVDGISLTYGNPRQHIWTFAAALSESSQFHSAICPCIDNELFMSSLTITPPPAFIGEDYFCDTALNNDTAVPMVLHTTDPLWDGAGCGPVSTCCTFNTPPWFYKELPQPTTEDIEMRICSDQPSTDEDTPIKRLDIYVQ